MLDSASGLNFYGFASVPAVKQYLEFADVCGVDSMSILKSANIHPTVLQDNGKRISIESMEQLLSELIHATKDPGFGLHSAVFVQPAYYSVLGYISMNCSTLRETLANVAIFEKIVGDMGVSTTSIEKGLVYQLWDCRFNDPLVRRHVIENVLGSWVVYLRDFVHLDAVLPDRICFEHAAPNDPEQLEEYARVFDCEIQFEQPASGVIFREELLDVAVPQADKKLLKALLDHASQILTEIDRDQSTTAQVKNILRLMLKERETSCAHIAEVLHMSTRTLQRKLNEEATQYKAVLNEVRLELAQYYLENTSLGLEQISHELGYSEARSFYRSFKQWTGRTAGSYRAEKS